MRQPSRAARPTPHPSALPPLRPPQNNCNINQLVAQGPFNVPGPKTPTASIPALVKVRDIALLALRDGGNGVPGIQQPGGGINRNVPHGGLLRLAVSVGGAGLGAAAPRSARVHRGSGVPGYVIAAAAAHTDRPAPMPSCHPAARSSTTAAPSTSTATPGERTSAAAAFVRAGIGCHAGARSPRCPRAASAANPAPSAAAPACNGAAPAPAAATAR